MKTRTVIEGNTRVEVPLSEDSSGISSPSTVFYNPEMELNRDITVAATLAYALTISDEKGIPLSEIKYIDALSASGIRGLRVANETGINTTLNDWSNEAYEFILKNIEMNDLAERVIATRKNANVALHENKYHIVDLDPFGTPAPFLNAASSSTISFLEVTATDTAPLCGAHLKSGIRKYSSVPLNNEYHSEMGIRVLIGKIVREFASNDKAIYPVLSHATRHYLRIYAEVRRGAKRADRMMENMGFIENCQHCGFREPLYGLAVHSQYECPSCKSPMSIAGPLWLGSLHSRVFCNGVLEQIDALQLGKKDADKKIITLCREELDIPMFYDQHVMCKQIGISAPGMDSLINKLLEKGFNASRTHFSGTSFKTNAPVNDIKQIMRSLD